MREIKFRGLRDYDNKWVYGSLIKSNYSDRIIDCDAFETRDDTVSDTIGQYTGLKDKNGVEIFEGDVVRILYTDWPSYPGGNMSLQEYKISISKIGVITYDAPEWCIQFKGYTDNILPGKHGEIEVIGNIHQNSELLK